jgi:hypothetical protein
MSMSCQPIGTGIEGGPHKPGRLAAADWLSLAAAPTFTVMALLTASPRGWPAGHALLGRGTYVAAERNDPDVLTDERLPFVALAEADL